MFELDIKSINIRGSIESPISGEKLEKCYVPNGDTYPLCKGQFGNCECKDCNLYENMIGG